MRPACDMGDMARLTLMNASLQSKFYIQGFLYGRQVPHCSHQQQHHHQLPWMKFYAELTGSLLKLWKVSSDFAAASSQIGGASAIVQSELQPSPSIIHQIKSDPCTEIDVTSSIAFAASLPYNPYGPSRENQDAGAHALPPPPPIPYDSFLVLTGFSNQFYSGLYLSAPSTLAANAWISAIALVNFEIAKLNEYYTLNLLKDPPFYHIWDSMRITPFNTDLCPSKITFSGSLDVLLPSGHGWRTMYAALVGPSTAGRPSKTGLLSLYDSKKDCRMGRQRVIIHLITQVYGMFPDTAPKSIGGPESPGIFRVEGVVRFPRDKSPPPRSLPPSKLKLKSPLVPSSTAINEADGPSTGPVETPPLDEEYSGLYMRAPRGVFGMAQWAVAIMGAFGIDADLVQWNRSMSDGECGFVQPDSQLAPYGMPPLSANYNTSSSVQATNQWGLLYLSTWEVAGIDMRHMPILMMRFELQRVLKDKIGAKAAGHLEWWAATIRKEARARQQIERKEVEAKVKESQSLFKGERGVVISRSHQNPRPHSTSLTDLKQAVVSSAESSTAFETDISPSAQHIHGVTSGWKLPIPSSSTDDTTGAGDTGDDDCSMSDPNDSETTDSSQAPPDPNAVFWSESNATCVVVEAIHNNGWRCIIPATPLQDGTFVATPARGARVGSRVGFKFVVDGRGQTSGKYPTDSDGADGLMNWIICAPPCTSTSSRTSTSNMSSSSNLAIVSITNSEQSEPSEPRVPDPDLILVASSSICSSPSSAQVPPLKSVGGGRRGNGVFGAGGRQSIQSLASKRDASLRRRVSSWLSNPGVRHAKKPNAPSEATTNSESTGYRNSMDDDANATSPRSVTQGKLELFPRLGNSNEQIIGLKKRNRISEMMSGRWKLM
ncbi:hypothetical protein SeLEV6574_g07054 [Synchytrium endobioticum]|uniref:Uncharacterized protein n=1 Tax=Synchytrium endobioticum TaxID=286115 RepID=A0A507CJK4_9FUNG|nr:hypothetical protein SeLEV6574_g07054 [Synchytrium endobioticum]